ncbi:hypothetical protein JW890_03775 [candidate division WOR-3 bacterium]|nr:hypothetical protein [candidate division WOR-3 bacterium]
METIRSLSNKIYERKFTSLTFFLLALLFTCGPKNTPKPAVESYQPGRNFVFEALEKTFSLPGFSAELIIRRTGYEVYPDVDINYSVLYVFPDRIQMKPMTRGGGEFSEEVIAIGSREYHFTEGEWIEFPRTDLSDLFFQAQLVLIDSNLLYVERRSAVGETLFYAFKPNLPLFDPLGKIITTGEAVIFYDDTLLKSLKAFSPDSSFLWSLEIKRTGIPGEIRPPSLLSYFIQAEFDDNSDTSVVRSRLQNIGCSGIKISVFRRTSEIEFMSESEYPLVKRIITAEGFWEICRLRWIYDDPGKYISDPSLVKADFGPESRIGFIAGIPFKPVILQKTLFNCTDEEIRSSEISYGAVDRISLKIFFSESGAEMIGALEEGSKIGLVLDGSLVAVADAKDQEGGFSFFWEREGMFEINGVRAILNSSHLSGEVRIKD